MSARVRAAVMPAPHQPIRVDEFLAPNLEPGAVVLEASLSEVCGTDHFHRAVTIAARHQAEAPWAAMVTARYGLDRAGEALRAVERQEVLKALICPALA